MTQDLSQLSMLERIAAQTKQAAPAPKPVAKPAPTVRTSDGRFLKVQVVDEIRLDRRFLLTHPEAQPVTIPRDVFAPHSPNRDVRLSGAQVIKTPGRMDQADGKTAHDLIGQRRIRREQTGYSQAGHFRRIVRVLSALSQS